MPGNKFRYFQTNNNYENYCTIVLPAYEQLFRELISIKHLKQDPRIGKNLLLVLVLTKRLCYNHF
jgi:hypothetical protein